MRVRITFGPRMPFGSVSSLIRHIMAGGLCAPFRLDERRHVETGTVLGLERAVVLADDEVDEFLHEGGVSLCGLGSPKFATSVK